MVQMRHSCTISGRKQPEKVIRRHLFPLSIKDGEGARGQERYGVSLQRPATPATSATNLPGKTLAVFVLWLLHCLAFLAVLPDHLL